MPLPSHTLSCFVLLLGCNVVARRRQRMCPVSGRMSRTLFGRTSQPRCSLLNLATAHRNRPVRLIIYFGMVIWTYRTRMRAARTAGARNVVTGSTGKS
jgi:hypothetical protein